MTVEYAVLKGRVVGSVRTEVMEQRVNAAHLGNGPYRSNHFHLLVQAADGLWRCPVNVRSQDGSEVWFKIRDSLRDHPTPPPAPRCSITVGLSIRSLSRPMAGRWSRPPVVRCSSGT